MIMQSTTDISTISKGRILVVDDEERMCVSLKNLLERENHDVIVTCNGDEALQLIQSNRFDMIITDIKMPITDGIDILRKAKEIDPHLVVILMTGFASLETAKAAINRGAFDYITKPLEFEELLRSIGKGLTVRAAQLEKQHLLELLSSSNSLLQNRVNQLHALYKSAGVLSETIELSSLLEQIINLVTSVVGAKSGSIMLLDDSDKRLRISAYIGIELDEESLKNLRVPIGEGVSGYVAQIKESVIIDNISNDNRFKHSQRDRYETESAISVPIIHRSELLGVINLNNKEGNEKFTVDDLRLLETFSSHAAIAIENARLFEENKKKLNELTILHRIATRLSSSKSETEVFSALFEGIKSMVKADFCYFFSINDDGVLKVTFAEDPDKENTKILQSTELKIPSNYSATPEKLDQQLWVEQFLKGYFLDNTVSEFSSFISVPVSVENSISGFLCIGCYSDGNYSEETRRLISIIASQAASLYERQRSIINGTKLLTMGKMISELTHDLKKPLTNIKGTLQILESRMDDPQVRNDILQSTLQEVDRLADLVREMLDFSDPGKYTRSDSEIMPIIEKALSLLSTDLRKNSIEVVKDFEPELPKVLINQTEIFESILNIILNAIESMSNGGTLSVSVHQFTNEVQPEPYLRVDISDEGCGIPRDKINKVFERYYTTKDGGTGLGLALVKRVMQSHDGFIGIESEEGKGTRIILDFPI